MEAQSPVGYSFIRFCVLMLRLEKGFNIIFNEKAWEIETKGGRER